MTSPSAAHPVRVGCSGWSYDDWRDVIYPEGLARRRWLERYAELFDTVEVNATFYRLQSRSTVEGWAEQVPDGFLFAVKASRYLTHVKRLSGIAEGVKRFWEPLEPLRAAGKLGPVLWQLPPNFERDDAVLEGALRRLPEGVHCFEFRHESWFTPAVSRLLDAAGASLVVAHDARTDAALPSPAGSVAYIRLHYGARGRRGNYSASELATWRRRLGRYRAERDVFVYLNNDWEGFAPRNALALGQSPESEAGPRKA